MPLQLRVLAPCLKVCVVLLFILLISTAASAQCSLNPASPSVTICQPTNGGQYDSPVRVLAGTTSATTVTGIWVYVNNKGVYNVKGSQVDISLSLTPGAHQITVKAWNSGGQSFQSQVIVNVRWTTPPPCPLNQTSPSVTICAPQDGSIVMASPLQLRALTNSGSPVTGMYAYVDGVAVYNSSSNQIDTLISLTDGAHKITVRAWAMNGTVFEKSINVTKTTPPPPPPPTEVTQPGPLTSGSISISQAGASFPQTAIGAISAAQRITITNNKTSSVTVNSIALSDANFSMLQNCGIRIAAKRSCEINVTFRPKVGGDVNASVWVDVQGAGSALNLPLKGSAVSETGAAIPINHIIFMLQENRSFDHYFSRLKDYRLMRGFSGDVDVASATASNQSPNGMVVTRFKSKSMCIEPVTPVWTASHADVNRFSAASDWALMDGFVSQAAWSSVWDKRGARAMSYHDENDLPYYYYLATEFATSDRWFSPVPAVSSVNRMYVLAGTSIGRAKKPNTTFSDRTIFHLLEERGISWKVYYTDVDGNGTPSTQINTFQPFASQWRGKKIVPMSEYFIDLQNGTLPQVVLIESGYNSGRDEHPGGTILGKPNTGNHIQRGAAHAAKFINALMTSSAWKDSVFILTYDEGGGLYDHVPPAFNATHPDGIKPVDLSSSDVKGDFTRFGFRLPLIVISPYARRGYVSHTMTDFTAIDRLIEKRFNLPSLSARTASQTDMLEFFDFANPPWMTPPVPPAQPTNGVCDYTTVPQNW